MFQRNTLPRFGMMTLSGVLALTVAAALKADSVPNEPTTFQMVVSAGAKSCLPNATATVTIRPGAEAEVLEVAAQGLVPNAEFEFFVVQVPKAPFGIAWYQGSIQTDKQGRGFRTFIGRFSNETFTVANGPASAPLVFTSGPFPNASVNPSFLPIQMYHLGLWFSSSQVAANHGCPAAVTPFNGEHNAGIQVLNTSNFADDHGPLRDVQSPGPQPSATTRERR
jgi:hypothetical protein